MATKYSPNKHTIAEANQVLSDAFLETEWSTMAQLDQDTWLTNSQFNTTAKSNDATGKLMFLHYFGQSFGAGTNSNITTFLSTTLGAGLSDAFVDRAGRTWATT